MYIFASNSPPPGVSMRRNWRNNFAGWHLWVVFCANDDSDHMKYDSDNDRLDLWIPPNSLFLTKEAIVFPSPPAWDSHICIHARRMPPSPCTTPISYTQPWGFLEWEKSFISRFEDFEDPYRVGAHKLNKSASIFFRCKFYDFFLV